MAGISFAVSTIFKSKDEQSKNFKRMGKNAKLFGKQTSKAFKSASKSAKKFGSITKGILKAGAITKVIGGLATGIGVVTTEFLDFDDAITQASAKFKGLNLATKEGQETLEKLKKTAREVGKTTKFSASEAAAGLNFYATAGLKADAAMKLLAPTARFAMAANLGLARTADIASDSLGIFGLNTKDPIKLGQNFAKMSDQMASTMTSSNLTLEELFETTKVAGKIFKESGQSMATFNAFTRSLTDSSIKGEKAGTGLRAFMAKLAKPTGEAADALEILGVKTDDGTGNFRDAIDILADFEKGMARFGDKQKLALTKTVFGLETMTAFTALIGTGSKNLREFREQIENSGGSTEKMAKIMEGSLINRLLGLKSAAIDVGFQLFEAFSEKGAGAITKLTEIIRKIDLGPFIEKIKSVSKIAIGMFNKFTAFGKKTGIFEAITKSINDAKPLLKDVFEFGKDIFNKFVDIAEKAGLFDKIKTAINGVMPLFKTLFDVVKTVFNLLNDVGVFDALGVAAGIILDTVTGLAKAVTSTWNTLKPLLEETSKFFKSVSGEKKAIGPIPELIKKPSDVLSGEKTTLFLISKLLPLITTLIKTRASGGNAGGSLFGAGSLTPEEIAASKRKLNRGANQTQLESRATQVDISGNINFQNAPEGTTFTPTSAPAQNIDFNELGTAN